MNVGTITQLTNHPPRLEDLSAAFPCRARSGCSAAYIDGRKAYMRQVKVGDNPHAEDTDEHWDWLRGWADEGMASRRHLLPNSVLDGNDPPNT